MVLLETYQLLIETAEQAPQERLFGQVMALGKPLLGVQDLPVLLYRPSLLTEHQPIHQPQVCPIASLKSLAVAGVVADALPVLPTHSAVAGVVAAVDIHVNTIPRQPLAPVNP